MDITLQHLVEDHLCGADIAITGHLEGIALQDGLSNINYNNMLHTMQSMLLLEW